MDTVEHGERASISHGSQNKDIIGASGTDGVTPLIQRYHWSLGCMHWPYSMAIRVKYCGNIIEDAYVTDFFVITVIS